MKQFSSSALIKVCKFTAADGLLQQMNKEGSFLTCFKSFLPLPNQHLHPSCFSLEHNCQNTVCFGTALAQHAFSFFYSREKTNAYSFHTRNIVLTWGAESSSCGEKDGYSALMQLHKILIFPLSSQPRTPAVSVTLLHPNAGFFLWASS